MVIFPEVKQVFEHILLFGRAAETRGLHRCGSCACGLLWRRRIIRFVLICSGKCGGCKHRRGTEGSSLRQAGRSYDPSFEGVCIYRPRPDACSYYAIVAVGFLESGLGEVWRLHSLASVPSN